MHFNAAGQADRFESKQTGAWFMIYMMGGLALMFAALPIMSPKTKSIEQFRPTYDALTFGLMLFMGGMQSITLNASGTNKLSMVPFGLLMCALFGFLGNLLGKVTPNYFVGIRTPWTLESPENWERTHRFAARICVGASILGALIILAGGSILVAISIVITAMLIPVAYSYWLYIQTNKTFST